MCVRRSSLCAATLVFAGLSGVNASAEVIDVKFDQPDLDRWMYTFSSSSAGQEREASVFSPLGSSFQSSFDNRDAQFLLGFDTAPEIVAGQPVGRYRIISAVLTARTSRSMSFVYDPTADAFNNYLASDPAYVPDSDPGQALELFLCGYRSPFGASTFLQTSPVASGSPFPSRSARYVFPAIYDQFGQLRDVSNNVEERFDARPLAVGIARPNADQKNADGNDAPFTPVNPGDLVPQNTDFEFTIDLTNPDALRGLREGLAAGRVNLMLTALTITTQGNASGVPAFYLRKFNDQPFPDPAAKPASLQVRVCVGPASDWNCSGAITVQDIFDFLSDWFAGGGDFNATGDSSVQDIFDFLGAWFAGN